jgi:hypothetical protein
LRCPADPHPVRDVATAHVSGITVVPRHPLPNLDFIDFIAGPLQASGIIAIVGRNVLRHFVLIYNGPGGCMSLAY